MYADKKVHDPIDAPKTDRRQPQGAAQRVADDSPHQQAQGQRLAQLQAPSHANGLPAQLRQGIESLSGFDMSDVRVHRNADKPTQLQAHAYAQGSDIYLAPGQERHLPHEAWHVVQQKQGRVRPTLQMKGGFGVNDDAGLEHEADVMEGRATSQGRSSIKSTGSHHTILEGAIPSKKTVQCVSVSESLKSFAGETSGGFLGVRSWELKKIDKKMQELSKKFQVGSESEVLNLIVEAENFLIKEKTNAGQGDQKSSTYEDERYANFENWKNSIFNVLDNNNIKNALYGFINSRHLADAGLDYQNKALFIGSDEELSGMGQLKSNKYAKINKELRAEKNNGKHSAMMYEAYRALKHYDENQGNKFMGKDGMGRYVSAGRVDRYVNDFFGIENPNDLEEGKIYEDKGFAFFGANAISKSNMKYLLKVKVCKAMVIRSDMYGSAEADDEYITAPGAKFVYRGMENEGRDIYFFEQI